MEAVSISDTSEYFAMLHGAVSQKAVIFRCVHSQLIYRKRNLPYRRNCSLACIFYRAGDNQLAYTCELQQINIVTEQNVGEMAAESLVGETTVDRLTKMKLM
jgi:hypothetical protein